MSPKELLYIDDALGHAQFLTAQFEKAAGQLTDAGMQQSAKQMAEQYRQMYKRFYELV